MLRSAGPGCVAWRGDQCRVSSVVQTCRDALQRRSLTVKVFSSAPPGARTSERAVYCTGGKSVYNRLQVIPGELRTAAGRAIKAGEQARAVDVSSPVADEVFLAMPGSRSAQLADQVGSHWRRQSDRWADATDDYSRRMIETAESYEDTDFAASELLFGTQWGP